LKKCKRFLKVLYVKIKGDEGSALVCKDRRSERYTVVGMASWGTTCGQSGFPVVFTNIANYYEWIKSVDPQIGQ
jgi:secreted trypsin-like serine protease